MEGEGEGAGEPVPVAGLVVPLHHLRQLAAAAPPVLEHVLEVGYRAVGCGAGTEVIYSKCQAPPVLI